MIANRHLKELILPILIILLSFVNFSGYITSVNLFALIVTVIGLIGVILYFLKKGNPNLMFKIWMFSQFPAIYSENIITNNDGTYITKETAIFNMEQFLSFSIGIDLELRSGTILNLGFYLIPLAYIGIYKLTIASHFVDKVIEFSPIKNETQFVNQFPINGKIIKRIELNKEKDWLLVECDEELQIDEIKSKNVLIKPKEEKTFKRKKRVISYLRIAKVDLEIPDIINTIEDYPFYEWVKIKVK